MTRVIEGAPLQVGDPIFEEINLCRSLGEERWKGARSGRGKIWRRDCYSNTIFIESFKQCPNKSPKKSPTSLR